MSDNNLLGLPAPGGDEAPQSTSGSAAGSAGRSSRRRARRVHNVRSVADCLAALDQLPGLVAMGVLTPAQASAMSRIFMNIIAAQQRTASGAAAAPLTPAARERFRLDPQLADDLGCVLSAEQLASVMCDSAEDEADE